ncbi:MAG: type II toxin-antitoxin system VapC family toxin [Chloroflexi bacterium]|nr:MAG: type II toxin-antitoxin system VapC family toxin [Chloroflexota bacterium]TMG08715.1 MAG: type II toxin-antitoxin system VapC family toxin [Chloroflexota bacterium]
MIVYLDASSLIKFHIEEEGSGAVRSMMALAPSLIMSRVGYAEARSGLARARDAGRLQDTAYRAARLTLDIQWAGIVIVDVSETLIQNAGDLAERHLLRGFDSIHLASALLAQDQGGEPVTFSAWDSRLLVAAQTEGLVIAPNA